MLPQFLTASGAQRSLCKLIAKNMAEYGKGNKRKHKI